VVGDVDAFGSTGAVFRVDPATGAQTTISSGGNFIEPGHVALDASGNVIVADGSAHALIRVNPATGAQTIISSGFVDMTGVGVESSGDILVVDQGSTMTGTERIIRVNPITGAQTIVSLAGSFVDPQDIAIDANGDILAVDSNAFGGSCPGGCGGVIRVNPITGAQSMIASGGNFVDPDGITIDGNGQLLIADSQAYGGSGGVIRVDPTTGTQTTVSSGGNFVTPVKIATEASANILVVDFGAFGSGAVIRVNPITGEQCLVSSGGNFVVPAAIAVVPGVPPVQVKCGAPPAVCGNGSVEAGEQCDDGNLTDGDGCDSNCTLTGCGNGIATAGEECDDGNSSSNDACKIDCTLNVCGDGVPRTCVEQCDDGNLTDGDGCESDCTFSPESASGTVGAGGSVTTDSEGDGATSIDPVESSVTSPSGGTISINESASTGGPPSGFTFVEQQVTISAPAATADMPLVLVFSIDASQLPPGVDQNTIEIFKDGVIVPACTGASGVASPDTCVSNRTLLADGDVEITVLTSTASVWTFAVHAGPVCGNGILETGEQCDDGNLVDGDGCSNTCLIESGWTCAGAPSSCGPLPPEPICTSQDINSKNAEKCASTYRAALLKCIKKGVALDTCDTSKSLRFCSQLSADCRPQTEIDDAVRIVYGDQPVISRCRRTLAFQATNLVRVRYTRARQGKSQRLSRDTSGCMRRVKKACAAEDPLQLQTPCDTAETSQDAAACVCTSRLGCSAMSPAEVDALRAGGWSNTRDHARSLGYTDTVAAMRCLNVEGRALVAARLSTKDGAEYLDLLYSSDNGAFLAKLDADGSPILFNEGGGFKLPPKGDGPVLPVDSGGLAVSGTGSAGLELSRGRTTEVCDLTDYLACQASQIGKGTLYTLCLGGIVGGSACWYTGWACAAFPTFVAAAQTACPVLFALKGNVCDILSSNDRPCDLGSACAVGRCKNGSCQAGEPALDGTECTGAWDLQSTCFLGAHCHAGECVHDASRCSPCEVCQWPFSCVPYGPDGWCDACSPNSTQTCSTGLPGICGPGTRTCNAQGTGYGSCVQNQ